MFVVSIGILLNMLHTKLCDVFFFQAFNIVCFSLAYTWGVYKIWTCVLPPLCAKKDKELFETPCTSKFDFVTKPSHVSIKKQIPHHNHLFTQQYQQK